MFAASNSNSMEARIGRRACLNGEAKVSRPSTPSRGMGAADAAAGGLPVSSAILDEEDADAPDLADVELSTVDPDPFHMSPVRNSTKAADQLETFYLEWFSHPRAAYVLAPSREMDASMQGRWFEHEFRRFLSLRKRLAVSSSQKVAAGKVVVESLSTSEKLGAAAERRPLGLYGHIRNWAALAQISRGQQVFSPSSGRVVQVYSGEIRVFHVVVGRPWSPVDCHCVADPSHYVDGNPANEDEGDGGGGC